jgi:hypothetical protein
LARKFNLVVVITNTDVKIEKDRPLGGQNIISLENLNDRRKIDPN